MLFDKNNNLNIFSDKFDELIIFTPQHTAHYKSAINMFRDQPIIGQAQECSGFYVRKKNLNQKY